jgi:hypothetical protein
MLEAVAGADGRRDETLAQDIARLDHNLRSQ